MQRNHSNRASLTALALCATLMTIIAVHATKTVSGNRNKSDNPRLQEPAVRAVANQKYIKLSDGRELSSGDVRAASSGDSPASELRPLALASADFDEDGIPDLITALGAEQIGMIELYRGDAIPNNALEGEEQPAVNQMTQSPFFPDPRNFDLTHRPDFIGAGDFDGDGHFDLAFASRQGNTLRLMSGDGRGALYQTKEILLPGRVTALAVGDLNRRDGFADIVAGVVTTDGPKALLFESPNGAINAQPEVLDLIHEATAFAIGQFDNDTPIDVAVAAGPEILLVHGRDRKLWLSDEVRSQVRAISFDRYELNFQIATMAAGDFKGNSREELAIASDDGSVYLFERTDKQSPDVGKPAKWKLSDGSVSPVGSRSSRPLLVSTQLSSLPKTDLVLGDQIHHRLNVVAFDASVTDPANTQSAAIASTITSLESNGEVVAVLPMRISQGARMGLVILKKGESHIAFVTAVNSLTFTVINTNDSGAGSLRQAILDSNNSPGTDTIVFNIGSGNPAINLSSPLPALTEAVAINGNSGGATRVVINGAGAGANANGLYILAGNCSINGLVIDSFSANGILIQTGGGNVITNCFVGVDPTGAFATPNSTGIFILNSANNLIGGTTPGVPNVISGNNVDGVRLDSSASTGNTIRSNYIGTNVGGTAAVGNAFNGVVIIGASNNNVGGSVAGSRNIISGNHKNGVGISPAGAVNATGNLVQRNYIGTNISGSADLGNWQNGVLIINASGNTIGGATSDARNLISGNNERGVKIMNNSATGNQVLGNYIGTNFDGTTALPNDQEGVRIEAAPSNSVGGANGAGNVISGNGQPNSQGGSGVVIEGSAAPGNTVQGNIIGLTANGVTPLGNTGDGVSIVSASNTTIGGTSVGARNVISGNKDNDLFGAQLCAGIDISGSASGCVIQGNYIGTDTSGTIAIGNSFWGITINEDVRNTIIGGSTAAARNLISGNGGPGISLGGSTTTVTGTVIRGNYIGTNASGTADLGNGYEGIFIDGAPGNIIGGTTGTTPGGGCTGDCNLISGNNKDGIQIVNGSASATVIQGNYIGTNAAGTAAIKNDLTGIHLWNINGTIVGGTTTSARNIVSGNGGNGIWKELRFNAGDTFQGNYIGVAANGTSPLGNAGHGILIDEAFNSTIGGTAAGAGNTIAFNGGDGVAVLLGQSLYGTRNTILSNSIFSNGGLGIDLDNNGVSPNDSGDGDTGANNLQNFPVLSLANNTGAGTGIAGALNSSASTVFTIQFFSTQTCDASGNGEGQSFIGSTSVTTNASGSASFSVFFSTLTSIGSSITATATDPNGNTSEFSACRAVTACTYSISPSTQSFAAVGGTGSVDVTAGPGCAWTAVSNAPWITITSGGSGGGDGTLSYSVAANAGPARTGTINIAGQTFTVNQSGGCAFSISPMSRNHSATAETGSVSVTAGAGCNWTATESLSWVTITSGSSGSGNGATNYSVTANTGSARSGTMSVAGQTFTINQASGCTSALGATSQSFAATASTGNTVTVTSPTGCAWTATVNPGSGFITISSGASGSGNGTVTYSVAANTSTGIRNGTISIAGQTFTVYQGIQFADVPVGSLFYTEIGKLSARGITLGCGGGNYCPGQPVLRDQMAAFIIRALGDFNPPTPTTQRFGDVPPSNPFYAFIDQMAVRQITQGCGGGNYCPSLPVLRQEMAAFLIRALGEFNPPNPPSQRFNDVPPSNLFYKFIDRLAALGITNGCSASPPLYCPTDTVTRAQMAAFLVRTFNL